MSKSSRQALGLVTLAVLLIALQAAAVWTAVLHVDELLASARGGLLARASQSVARAVADHANNNAAKITVTDSESSLLAPSSDPATAMEPSGFTLVELERLELPDAAPLDVECSESAAASAPAVKLDDCDPSTCPLPCGKARGVVAETPQVTPRPIVVARARSVAGAEWQDGGSDDAAPTVREERTRDRERERESRHESAIGPLKPAALGSVW